MTSLFYGMFSTLTRSMKVGLEHGTMLLKSTSVTSAGVQHSQIRGRYVDWRMRRDGLRRQMIQEQFPERLRLNTVRKNNILPKELQELADAEVATLPPNSSIVKIRNRCVVTSRPRGVQRKWRISRIVWRQLADYNQLSGVTRAAW
ncbi:small ribosomal subunit protein uS14m-like [Haliotis cracherodii]|uniref:small ribosomal subunit protein uS14m-like n=1 Tax=Haliotis cracherodii TaxID=6455 RepID=UPI001EAFE5C7|nr:28S ribosomal protein S14, mitochondrial-like isoform X2 [Haliotis rufescens]